MDRPNNSTLRETMMSLFEQALTEESVDVRMDLSLFETHDGVWLYRNPNTMAAFQVFLNGFSKGVEDGRNIVRDRKDSRDKYLDSLEYVDQLMNRMDKKVPAVDS